MAVKIIYRVFALKLNTQEAAEEVLKVKKLLDNFRERGRHVGYTNLSWLEGNFTERLF
jgi:hypothetical protein